MLGNCLTGANADTGNIGRAPVDAELAAVVSTPGDVRHAANAAARTRAQGDVADVEVFAGLREVLQLEHQALEQGDDVDAPLTQAVGRGVLELLVGLHPLANPNRVVAIRLANVLNDVLIRVLLVAPGRELLADSLEHVVDFQTLGDEDGAIKAAGVVGDLDIREVHAHAEVLAVELLPLDTDVRNGEGVLVLKESGEHDDGDGTIADLSPEVLHHASPSRHVTDHLRLAHDQFPFIEHCSDAYSG